MLPRCVPILILLSLAIAGCGANVSQLPVQRPPGTLIWTVAGASDISTLDPAQATDTASIDACQMLYEGLVRLNTAMHVVPAAADWWKESQHGLRYVFHLRRGLRFSSGTPLTASDVVASFRRALALGSGNGVMGGYLNELAIVRGQPAIFAPQPGRVEFLLSRPSPQFLPKLTFVGADIVDMRTVNRYGAVWTSHPDGLGPYRLVRWTPGVALTLAPNSHFLPHPPVRRLRMTFASQSAAVDAFASGRADIVTGLTPRPTIQHRYPSETQTFSRPALDFVIMNAHRHALANAHLRAAFAFAVDRDLLTHKLFGSAATPVGSVVPPALLPGAYQQVYDPQAALAQLKLSGHPYGRGLPHFRFIFPNTPTEVERASILQATWLRVLGLRVLTIPLPYAEYATAVRRGQFDLATVQWGAEYPDPANFLDRQLHGGSPGDLAGWNNVHFDRLIDASRLDGTDSPARRLALLGAAQLAAEKAPWIPLDSPVELTLVRNSIHGVTSTPEGLLGIG